METRILRYFIAVAELGSVSAAARLLNVAQPALSRHIRRLEQQLSATLMLRNARGVVLTEAGERLFRHSLSVMRQIELIPKVVGGPASQISGRVSIGLPTTVGAILSMPLLQAIGRDLPDVRLHVTEALSGHLLEWMRAGRLDLAILFDAAPEPQIQLEELLVEELSLVGAPCTMPRARTVPFVALARYPLVLPGGPHSLRRLLEGMARSHGTRLCVALEVDSLSLTKSLAVSGEVFAILTEAAAADEIAAGRLGIARIVQPTVSRSVSLALSALPGRTLAAEEVGRRLAVLVRQLRQDGHWPSAVDSQ